MSPHRLGVLTLLVFLVFSVGTVALSRVRTIDGDEGFYATAAGLVSEGSTPYADFFFPQMPLMPYLYAPIYRVVGSSLMNMRLMSVAAGILSLFLWWLVLKRRLPDRPGLVLAGLMFVAVNPYFLSWNVTVKTYALTNLAVFAVLEALDRGLATRRPAWFLVGGLIAGLCVGVRLTYLPWAGVMVLVLGWFGRWDRENGGTLKGMFTYLGGMILGLTPSAIFWAMDPDRFLFNNFRYHLLRSSVSGGSGEGGLVQARMALDSLGDALFSNPFMVFQLVLVVWGVDWARRPAARPWRPVLILSGVGAATHLVVNLFPDPVYEQYFTGPLTPMLAPLAVAGLARLVDWLKKPGPVLAGALVLAGLFSVIDLQVRKTGMDWKEMWSFEHLAEVSAAIERHSGPDDMVLAFWPGYVFESGRVHFPGLENHFAVGVSVKLTLEENIRYHLAGKELIMTAFTEQYPRVVVLGTWMHSAKRILGKDHGPLLYWGSDRTYETRDQIGGVKIMTRIVKPESGRRPQ